VSNEEKILTMFDKHSVMLGSLVDALKELKAETNHRLDKIEHQLDKIEADVTVIKKQQSIDSDSIDNIYKMVENFRNDFDTHSHDTNRPKVSVV